MAESSRESQKYRTFMQPFQGPTTDRSFVSERLQNGNSTMNRSQATNMNMTNLSDMDFGHKESEVSILTLQSKLGQLQRWIKNIDDEITSERRDLMLLKGKINTVDIQAEYDAEQCKKNCKNDVNKAQAELDRICRQMRRDTFDLQTQIPPLQTADVQLKRDVNKQQRRVAGMSVDIGQGRVRKTKQRQLQLQEKKQELMGKTLYNRVNTTYSYADMRSPQNRSMDVRQNNSMTFQNTSRSILQNKY